MHEEDETSLFSSKKDEGKNCSVDRCRRRLCRLSHSQGLLITKEIIAETFTEKQQGREKNVRWAGSRQSDI